LTQLSQHAIAAFWMHKGDFSAVRAISGLLINHPRPTAFQPGNGRLNVIHLICDMVDTGTVFLQNLAALVKNAKGDDPFQSRIGIYSLGPDR